MALTPQTVFTTIRDNLDAAMEEGGALAYASRVEDKNENFPAPQDKCPALSINIGPARPESIYGINYWVMDIDIMAWVAGPNLEDLITGVADPERYGILRFTKDIMNVIMTDPFLSERGITDGKIGTAEPIRWDIDYTFEGEFHRGAAITLTIPLSVDDWQVDAN